MSENQKTFAPRSYKERFEFELTVGENIICQRYFRINNFNEESLRSYELIEALRRCVRTIDNDLKLKTQTYLELYAPMVFNTEDEMYAFMANPHNSRRLSLGEGIVVRGNKTTDYVLADECKVRALGYKFAFKIDGREVAAMTWDGYYPKFVRDKIDLSNKRGKFDGDDTTRLSFEQYLLYKMVQDKSDLIYGLIMHICTACSLPEGEEYTTDPDEIIENWKESRRCVNMRFVK